VLDVDQLRTPRREVVARRRLPISIIIGLTIALFGIRFAIGRLPLPGLFP
jgi:hypothetical protein